MRLLACGCLLFAMGAARCGEWEITDAAGDGETDNTAVFQRVLDEAAKHGGGIVNVPSGHYRMDGTLSIPGGVTLQGTFRVPPTDQREQRPKLDGAVLLAYAGRGAQDGEPFIRLAGSMATLRGFIINYPEWQQADAPPIPYPPTVLAERMANVGVLDCCFLNAYEAIHFQGTGRFLVRNVYGYPSFRGLYVDECYDIGRVENCHFWPFGVAYDPANAYCEWVNTQGVAFEFARTDWQYVLNTFCFGYGVGYKFSENAQGSCNGNFVGIGADCCRRAVLVEQSQPPGLLITNGEFVGRWGSTDSVCVDIAEGAGEGKVSLNNCSFWGPSDRCIWLKSPKVQLTATGCNFCTWDSGYVGSPAVQLDAGKAILQGNTFGDGDAHVRVSPEVVSAIVMGNQAAGGFVVENEAGARTQLVANEASPVAWSDEAKSHYRVDVGSDGDRPYVKLWHGQEKAGEWPDAGGTKRWSTPESVLRLPVCPQTPYALTLDIRMPRFAVDPDNGLYLGETRLVEFPASEGTATVIATIPPTDKDKVVLRVRVKTWQPKDHIDNSEDPRQLGICVRSATMKAEGAQDKLFNANTGQWAE